MTPGWPGALGIAVALSLLYSANAVSAGIYTWEDGDGVVHFSDREPPQGSVRQVVPAAPVLVPMNENLEAAEAITETVGLPEPPNGGRSSASSERQEQKRRCNRYRRQLDNIQSQLRAGYSGARGNRLRERRRSLSGKLSRECILGQGEAQQLLFVSDGLDHRVEGGPVRVAFFRKQDAVHEIQ